MARATQQVADDIPLIEEQVDTGLGQLMAGYRSPYNPMGDKKDDLLKRFTIFTSERLPELDTPHGQAFEALDDFNTNRQIYAVVCEPGMPYRQHNIDALLGATVAHLPALYGAGTVHCSHLNESRYVLFIERPHGTRLSQAMQTQPRLHEHRLIDYVLQPVIRALIGMKEKKTSHGNICPSTIYVGDNGGLNECYSTPASTLAHYIYEPIERLMCNPLSHGEANEKSDVFALGILAYELLYGLDRYKKLSKEDYIKAVLTMTTYQLFAMNREFSDAFQDFFRGTLNDNANERWSLDQVAQWLNGKRFNMTAPLPPKEAARPFSFGGENFFSRTLLAHAFHRNWREAVKDAKGMKLERWCESSLHRPELAEKVERALRIAGEASTEKHISDMMTRIIAILDQQGPLRSLSLSLRPDAMGLLLANFFLKGEQTELTQLLNMIENNVAAYWADLIEANKLGEMNQALWRLSKVKPFIKNRAFGFGVERVLYDLNPSLSCQSDLVRSFHITNAGEALRALDAISHNCAPDTSFADRHIAAFVAAKIDLAKEIRLDDLATMPTLVTNEELIVLRILARAQIKVDRNNKMPLVGLCTWAAMRIEKMLDEIHNRILRKRLKLQLRRLASSGDLNAVLGILLNSDIAQRDHNGFTQAIALHQINQKKIDRFENPRLIEIHARDSGGRMAMVISYLGLAVTSYFVFTNTMGM